jgi:hypothetical protein
MGYSHHPVTLTLELTRKLTELNGFRVELVNLVLVNTDMLAVAELKNGMKHIFTESVLTKESVTEKLESANVSQDTAVLVVQEVDAPMNAVDTESVLLLVKLKMIIQRGTSSLLERVNATLVILALIALFASVHEVLIPSSTIIM